MTLKDSITSLPPERFTDGDISIRPIRDDYDLWYATVECELSPEEWDYVNPAGFSIGRAYLNPDDNIPCVILHRDRRIGYIVLRTWHDGCNVSAASWSCYIDRREQGHGYGTAAARLAVKTLKAALPDLPIKLSVEKDNIKGQRLYEKVGFVRSGELDGDDLVFVHK